MFKIVNEDVFDGLNKVKDESVDLIFIDPPYNLKKKYANDITDTWNSDFEYIKWVERWLEIAISKLKPNGSLYIMNTTQNMPFIDLYLRDKLHIKSRIVWHYDSSGVQAKRYYGSLYEPILFCTKNKNKYTFNGSEIAVKTMTGSVRKLIDYRKNPPQMYNETKIPGNVWYFPRVRFKMKEYVKHPSQKPISLLQRIVLASSNENDTVLDLFAGSFSLGVVCKQLNRNYIGIELSKSYCQLGEKRLCQ